MGFRIAVTSDSQYPWYDATKIDKGTGKVLMEGYPPGISGEPARDANSKAQILGQYAAINAAADLGSANPIEAVIINGDLTSWGGADQLDVLKDALATLKVASFPALGNHDYSNVFDSPSPEQYASRMVRWMWDWIQDREHRLRSFDFGETDPGFPDWITKLSGSLAYSFNVGPVHCVMLHNYPFYTKGWSYLLTSFDITSSLNWLGYDLQLARERGDAIFVFTHAYNDDQFEPGPSLETFNRLMSQYDVSAVFAGHLHWLCQQVDTIQGGHIPVFRSGSSSQQDFLMVQVEFEPTPVFTVSCLDSKTNPPSNEKTNYVSKPIYTGPLKMTVGEMAIVGGRMMVGDSSDRPRTRNDDPSCSWGVGGAREQLLGHGFGFNFKSGPGAREPSGSCYIYGQVTPADDVAPGTMVVTGGYVSETEGGEPVNGIVWGQKGTVEQRAGQLWSWVDGVNKYVYLTYHLAPWGDTQYKPFMVTGGVTDQMTSNQKELWSQANPWGYQAKGTTSVLIGTAFNWINVDPHAMMQFRLYPAP